MKKLALVWAVMMFAVPSYAANTVVTQSHTSFDVDDASLTKGDTITFSNKDDVTHNIQILDSEGNMDDKGLQKPGEDIKAKFDAPGEYKVHCAIHPKMKMTITVK
jgi:plastocyanin